jgi:hypothetical protein
MRSYAIGAFLALIAVGCGTVLSGVVLPLKGAADADYPAPAAIPVVDVSRAALDKVRANRTQLLCEVKGGQVQVSQQLLWEMQENAGVWRAPVIDDNTKCAGSVANDPALASLAHVIAGGAVTAFGVACDRRGAFFQVNEQCFGPYDRVYRSHFQGILGASGNHSFGLAAYSDVRAEFIHMVVKNSPGAQVFVLCDLSRYVAPGGNIEFAADVGNVGGGVEAYLVPPGPGRDAEGWFIRSPRGTPLYGGDSSCALGRYRIAK